MREGGQLYSVADPGRGNLRYKRESQQERGVGPLGPSWIYTWGTKGPYPPFPKTKRTGC